MRILTVVVIVVVAVIVTIVATAVVLRRHHKRACTTQQGSWLDEVLARGSAAPPSTEAKQPGMLERMKELLAVARDRYGGEHVEARGKTLETERRLSSRPTPRSADIGTRRRRESARPTTKRKRGDQRERERKRVYESRCREILERVFRVPFPKVRPAWLRNELRDSRTGTGTMHTLELDCYNEELGIALEYNGRQHRVYPNTWHATKKEFDDQKKRDRLKVVRCKEEDVHLIVVPDAEVVPYDKLYTYITERLEALGILEFED